MKNKIINKAAELFLTLGFKSVTMDDIASAMGIYKKTIYVHFKNKPKLVEAVTFTIFENICDGIDCICEDAPNPIAELYQIKKFVMVHLNNEKASPIFQLKKYYPSIYNVLQSKQFSKMNGSVTDSLKKGIDMDLFRANIDIDFISRLYFNGMSGIKDESLFPREQFSMEYLQENFLEYHLRAIVTEKGMTILNEFIKNSNVTTNA